MITEITDITISVGDEGLSVWNALIKYSECCMVIRNSGNFVVGPYLVEGNCK